MITEKDLNETRRLSRIIQQLEEERERAYLAYSSPRYDIVKSNSPSKADPTARAVNRVIELDEKIDGYTEQFEILKDKIRSEIDDPIIRSIMFWYYILGYDWEEIPVITRNMRKKLRAYIEEHMKEPV